MKAKKRADSGGHCKIASPFGFATVPAFELGSKTASSAKASQQPANHPQPTSQQSPSSPLSRNQIAAERIAILLSLASHNAKKDGKFSKRCISLALKLAKRHRVRLSKRQKMLFCKKCHAAFLPGFNVSIHLDSKRRRIVHECSECHYIQPHYY